MSIITPAEKTSFLPWGNNKTRNDDCARYIAALAHEVRNPLTNINLSVEMIISTVKDDELKKYLDIIVRGSAHINDLINELLKYQLAEDMPPEEYSIHRLLNDALLLVKDRITLKHIQVKKSYTAEDCKIFVNGAKMKIALTNIIINAIDAMPPENGELELLTKINGGKCFIGIKDNGTGIIEENLKNIFNPYFTNKLGGMGLGLSTTLDFLQSDHGEVDVQSEEGQGTSVIVSFDRVS